jgi:hypothetical protein
MQPAFGWGNGVAVRTVQRGFVTRLPALRGWLLTGLAALLVLVALNAPTRLREMEPTSFLRLPLEALVFLAVVLAVPSRFRKVRVGLALVAGLALAATAVVKLLDIGFQEALDRPFDTVTDWGYADLFVETLRSSVGTGTGWALLAAIVVLVVGLFVLLPLAVVRTTRVATTHRRRAAGAVAALTVLWLALSLLDVRGVAGDVASRDTAAYVYGQFARVPETLREEKEFIEAAQDEPVRKERLDTSLAGLRGQDVLLVFIESYGRVAVEGSWFSAGVRDVLTDGERRLGRAGWSSRSAFLTSPTFGAVSWLAHATLQSGLWTNTQPRYDVLVKTKRLTLTRLFGQRGWRTVGVVPANTRDWPQASFYDFDRLYDSRNVGYQGPWFGYPPMPDQYTLSAFQRLELGRERKRPLMAEIDLITSHAPWSRTPWMVPWSSIGDGSLYHEMHPQLLSEDEIWPSPRKVQTAYRNSIQYSLTALFSFLRKYGDEDTVVVVLGDHQPSKIVSGENAGHDVPISVIARDPAVMARISSWEWQPGLLPRPDAPVWRMDSFRDRFLDAFGRGPVAAGPPDRQTGQRSRGAR